MNKLVFRNVPLDEVPARFRQGLETEAQGTVTISVEAETGIAPTAEELETLLAEPRRAPPVSAHEAVARVRRLRDEWDG